MSKKSLLPQSRRHVFIFDEDWDYIRHLIERHHGRAADDVRGTSQAIRSIVHARVRQLKAREQRAVDEGQPFVKSHLEDLIPS